MTEPEQNTDDAAPDDATLEGPGDVERAGETTAAVAIHGPTDTRPVGADTQVKVADTPHPSENLPANDAD
ncbi:MAG TPA: hypothetical protein VNA19_03200 [Pyrinomonadaceae bacterium]|jgi:hypothetical protein|nr:hypothetical protein [Pyrinomonadaceae bacterium]